MLVNIADRASCVTNAFRRLCICPEAMRLSRNELRSSLSHEKESAQVVVLTPQIADDDARGDPGQSHESGETGGIVFAKASSAMKEKLVQIILLVFTWRQRIAKPVRPEKLERVVYCGTRIGTLGDPGLC